VLHLLTGVTQLIQTEIALFKALLQLMLVKSDDLFTRLAIVQADKRVNPIQPCVYIKRHHTPHYSLKIRNNLAGAELQSHTLA
jgi:hypothetical protein